MMRLFISAGLTILICCATAIGQTRPAPLGPSPKSSPVAEDIQPPPPPIPDAPVETKNATGPTPLELNPPLPRSSIDDPFQQTPRDSLAKAGSLKQASEEFANKRYAQAATMFAGADQRKEQFTPAQRDEWAYCRLLNVGARLIGKDASATEIGILRQEVESALRIGSERLAPFGKKLLDEIRKRKPDSGTTIAAGWQSIETASFRVHYQSNREQAAEVGQLAESARIAMSERWLGPAGGNWSPRCDVYLHATGNDYAKATGKPSEQASHSRVEIISGRVSQRRIDLHVDLSTAISDSLPAEVTQVILAEAFAEEPLPRWAVVGMAALSESPEGVARYQRAIPGLYKEGKLFAIGPFIERPGFPKPDSVTVFYAQSVSMVAYLVQMRGAKAFGAFLREAPRRGYSKALVSHYGFKDVAELQSRWLQHSVSGQ